MPATAKKVNKNEAILFIKATIDREWHIYSIGQKEGGPAKTTFDFSPSEDYALVGNIVEPEPLTKFEKAFGINVYFFEKEAIFQQKLKVNSKQATIKGKVNFMACNDHKCLPPNDQEFEIPIK